MTKERRRYFRIDETLGISYQLLNDENDRPISVDSKVLDALALVSSQDHKIEKLLLQLSGEYPQVTELVALLNQKLERILNHLTLEASLVGRIAHKVREVNISACGIAFVAEEKVAGGASIYLEIKFLEEDEMFTTGGIVVACETLQTDPETYYWRIDFVGMSAKSQEKLIQHIVQSQSAQLKSKRTSYL